MEEKKRIHRNLALASVEGIHLIFNESHYADKVVHRILKSNRKWGANDRRFIAETLYDAVRWKRLYAEIAGIKEHYSRENIWRFLAVQWVLKSYPLPEWKELKDTPVRRIKGAYDRLKDDRRYAASIPDWLDAMGAKELGEELWEKEIRAQNRQAPVVLRVNTLKVSPSELQELLRSEGVETRISRENPNALILEKRASVFQTKAYKNGYFEMQDLSSQEVALFMDIKPGQKIIDACAGAGGKTLHISALMQNKGQVIAMDIHPVKLKELKKRAKRNGVHNIRIKPIDSSKVIKKMKATADRLLIDAPCSGLGVLRRNPDYKWKLTPAKISELKATQAQLLEEYSSMLKAGGKMLYATCSILPSENEEQVERFLRSHKEFELVKEKRILTYTSGNDGFYMALLKKIK